MNRVTLILMLSIFSEVSRSVVSKITSLNEIEHRHKRKALSFLINHLFSRKHESTVTIPSDLSSGADDYKEYKETFMNSVEKENKNQRRRVKFYILSVRNKPSPNPRPRNRLGNKLQNYILYEVRDHHKNMKKPDETSDDYVHYAKRDKDADNKENMKHKWTQIPVADIVENADSNVNSKSEDVVKSATKDRFGNIKKTGDRLASVSAIFYDINPHDEPNEIEHKLTPNILRNGGNPHDSSDMDITTTTPSFRKHKLTFDDSIENILRDNEHFKRSTMLAFHDETSNESPKGTQQHEPSIPRTLEVSEDESKKLFNRESLLEMRNGNSLQNGKISFDVGFDSDFDIHLLHSKNNNPFLEFLNEQIYLELQKFVNSIKKKRPNSETHKRSKKESQGKKHITRSNKVPKSKKEPESKKYERTKKEYKGKKHERIPRKILNKGSEKRHEKKSVESSSWSESESQLKLSHNRPKINPKIHKSKIQDSKINEKNIQEFNIEESNSLESNSLESNSLESNSQESNIQKSNNPEFNIQESNIQVSNIQESNIPESTTQDSKTEKAQNNTLVPEIKNQQENVSLANFINKKVEDIKAVTFRYEVIDAIPDDIPVNNLILRTQRSYETDESNEGTPNIIKEYFRPVARKKDRNDRKSEKEDDDKEEEIAPDHQYYVTSGIFMKERSYDSSKAEDVDEKKKSKDQQDEIDANNVQDNRNNIEHNNGTVETLKNRNERPRKVQRKQFNKGSIVPAYYVLSSKEDAQALDFQEDSNQDYYNNSPKL